MTPEQLVAIEARLTAGYDVAFQDHIQGSLHGADHSYPCFAAGWHEHAEDIAALLAEVRRKDQLAALGAVFLRRLEKELGHELTADEIAETMVAAGVER